jgi:hypothetical protein
MPNNPLNFQDFVGTTADEQRWQIANAIYTGGDGVVTNSDVAVDSLGNRAPLQLTSSGRLEVDVLNATPADLTIIQGQLNTLIGLTTVQQAEVSGIQTQLASGVVTVSGGGGGGGGNGISTIQGFDGTAYHNVKTDTLGNLNVNVLSGGGSSNVTLSGVGAGVTLPVSGTVTTGRSWNLAVSTDSLTAAISSIPAVSLASGQNVGVSSLPAIPAGSNSIGSVVNNGGTVTLAAGSNTIGAISNSSFGVSTLPANLGTTALAPAYAQVTNFPATNSISGGTVSLGSAVSIAGGQSVSLSGGTVSLSTVAGGLGASALTPIYDSIVGGSLTLTSSTNPTLGAGTNAIGYITSPSTFTAGQQAVTASAAALPSAVLTTGVVLTNNATATVYLGTSGVTSSTGYALVSGASIGLAVQNLNVVYIIGTASTGNLSYIGS